MKRSSFSILYYIRESRIKKDGTAGIEVKITINGERCFFSTGKNIKAENWDKVKQIATSIYSIFDIYVVKLVSNLNSNISLIITVEMYGTLLL